MSLASKSSESLNDFIARGEDSSEFLDEFVADYRSEAKHAAIKGYGFKVKIAY